MFRALRTRTNGCGYERVADEPSGGGFEAKLKRVTTLPAKLLGSCRKISPESNFPDNFQVKQAKKASKIHPIFGLTFETHRRKKATAKPEFARYVEYVKEGGAWDVSSNMPVIYYK
ncbi:Sodium/potassium-transporting ATPase subunit alpha-1 like [Actinidia chinensis var. chinensis]|uniref:Sodium/potassium-transporting ATPase subunit alpha-1 like n=1 Tax=Actinidia chinensis var. chinensis TaxID=1590841 RepID=A0A2R6S2I2_ACTCC|nr:Sodium/potassium-transporting ATPase subunit alpha-1 like [Actinidia chinensis var. chinensis]